MKHKIFYTALLILLVSIFSKAQAQFIPFTSAQYKHLAADTLYNLTGCGVPATTPNSYKRTVDYYDSCNHVKYYWQPENHLWVLNSVDSSFMDTAYTRNDSLFGVKNAEEFFVYTSPTSASNQPLTFDDSDFTTPISYDGSSSQYVKINENKYALKSELNSDSTQALYVVDTISNYPKCPDADGNSYLVGTNPPDSFYCAGDSVANPFYDHKNEPVRNIGGVYNFYTPVVGDHLDVTNHKTSGSYRYGADSTWSLLPKFDRSDGNRDNFAPKFGSFNNKDAYIMTHNNDVMKFDKNGDIYAYIDRGDGSGHLDLTSGKKLIWVPDTLLAADDPIVIDTTTGHIYMRQSLLDSIRDGLFGGGSGSFNFDSALALKTTDDLAQGSTNLYNQTHTGDATGATALTLATVNSDVGSFTNANITVNAKGLVTAASNGSGGGGFTFDSVIVSTAGQTSYNFSTANIPTNLKVVWVLVSGIAWPVTTGWGRDDATHITVTATDMIAGEPLELRY